MGQELALVEPIALPDLARGKMPSLPAWAERSRSALATNLQLVHETFREVRTLPAALVPTPAQRAAMEAHQRSLNLSLQQTPEAEEGWAIKVAETASKLLMTLGGDKRSEIAAEAKGEAYAIVLEDVPWWAVEAAARAWYRGACGNDEKGQPYDYKWPPDPATLRKLAMEHVWKIKGRILELQDMLDAKPYVDHSADFDKGLAAWRALRSVADDPAAMKALTFDKAAELGRGIPPTAEERKHDAA